MTHRTFSRLIAISLGMLLACDCLGARRTLRVDFGGEWDTRQIGTADCPGSTVGSALLIINGITFSGRNNGTHLVDDYCQISVDDAWGSGSFFEGDETGLASLIGPNTNNAVHATRYSMLDDIRFDAPTGFQWGVYRFPNGVFIVGLYGMQSATLTSNSFIQQGATFLWRGDLNGYNGEYFCFRDSTFLGTWNGNPAEPNSACMAAFNTLFQNGFE